MINNKKIKKKLNFWINVYIKFLILLKLLIILYKNFHTTKMIGSIIILYLWSWIGKSSSWYHNGPFLGYWQKIFEILDMVHQGKRVSCASLHTKQLMHHVPVLITTLHLPSIYPVFYISLMIHEKPWQPQQVLVTATRKGAPICKNPSPICWAMFISVRDMIYGNDRLDN